jgi:hypothetical protein
VLLVCRRELATTHVAGVSAPVLIRKKGVACWQDRWGSVKVFRNNSGPGSKLHVTRRSETRKPGPQKIVSRVWVGGILRVARLVVLVAVVAISCAFAAIGSWADERKSTNYPSVGDTPPRPEKPAMTTDEISKLKKDLTTAHDRQAPKGEAKQSASQKKH